MAGNYPDPPGHRLAYHRDGSVLFIHDGAGVVTPYNQASAQDLNNENNGVAWFTTISGAYYVGIVFPELRAITNISVGWTLPSPFWGDATPPYGFQYSLNSTNGFDGTWTTVLAGTIGSANTSIGSWVGIRSYYTPVSMPPAKAVKFAMYDNRDNISIHHFFLYGSTGGGISPDTDRLRFWHPTLNQELAANYFDWGNIPQGSSADKQVRIRNESDTLTANGITITSSSIADSTPSFAGQHLFSTDGTNFSSSVVLSSLAPGALSSPITIRKVTPSNAQLSVAYAQLTAIASSWT